MIRQSIASWRRRAAVTALSVTLAMSPALAYAQSAIGSAASVVNQVAGTLDNATRTLSTKDKVFQDEAIRTSQASAADLLFDDATRLAVGPNSNVVLDEFIYQASANTGALAINVTVGVLRFVTGKLPSRAYRIKTPTATIGVRGTTLVVVVAVDGTTTVSVEAGSATITSGSGASQTVGAGLSSTVAPGAPLPTPPGPPPPTVVASTQALDAALSGSGVAMADAEDAGIGGLSVETVAIGAAAAVLLGALLVTTLNDDNEDVAASATATSTATSTQ